MSGVGVFNKEAEGTVPQRPEWLDDEPEIVAILNAFVDKLDEKPISDRARMPSVRLNKKITPRLYRHDELADRTWALLRDLDGLVFKLVPDSRRSPYDPEYVKASLRLLEGGEVVCRVWLGRPQRKRYRQEWTAAVQARAAVFADRGSSLLERPVKVTGKSADAVVAAFARIAEFSGDNPTLRQLSARVFWGHSKVLDAREHLLAQLYPGFRIAPRPVLVHVYLPETVAGVLFIENQDTYAHALAGRPRAVNRLALVYGAGFRGSAERVRNRHGVSLHYHGESDRSVQAQFETWWFDGRPEAWPTWFWGDLDYSGMAILKALRHRFGDMLAWAPGYDPMLKLLHEGGGHAPCLADKSEQIDPVATGCEYADKTLLPAVREVGRFVDQEVV